MMTAKIQAVLLGTAGLMLISSAFEARAQVTAYPAKGQTPEQQTTDTAACQQFAKSQTGFDPQQALQANSSQNAQQPTAVRPRKEAKEEKQELAQENKQNTQTQQKLQAYNKAEKVCLQGKGYSVG